MTTTCAQLQKQLSTYLAECRAAQNELAHATNFSQKEYYAHLVKEYQEQIQDTKQALNAAGCTKQP
jgi:hypothetical protein